MTDNSPTVKQEARELAEARLVRHLYAIADHAHRRDFPAALMALSDAQSTLDDLAVIE